MRLIITVVRLIVDVIIGRSVGAIKCIIVGESVRRGKFQTSPQYDKSHKFYK